MSDPQQSGDDKLKNLAASLSEELGTVPTGKKTEAPPPAPSAAPEATTNVQADDDEEISLDAMVSASSSAAAAAAPAFQEKKEEPKKAASDPEVLSLDDLDKILNEADPSFSAKMTSLGKDLQASSGNIDLRPMKLDKEILGITDKEEIAKRVPLTTRAVNAVVSGTNIGVDRMTDFTYNSAITIREKSKELPSLMRRIYQILRQDTLEFVAWYKSRSRLQKVNLYLLIAASLALVVVVGRTIQGLPILSPAEFPLLRSFEEVAENITDLKTDEPMEQFDSPLRNPEYVVLYKKMFVNLKAQGSSKNPMAAFEIFIEANSQESAIELKDRERQFKDVIARVFESIPYSDVATSDGKAKLKLILRRDLNQVLNKGRVKKVYFKTFFYKQ
jgi:flagellar basal body-associated protein FliL